MKNKDFFSLLNEFKPSLSLFLTYTVDKEVIDKIVESCGGRIIVVHDISKGITLNDNFKDRIVLIPAIIPHSLNNCFHSKIAILKNERNIRVVTGSMNLSRNSFLGHHEFFIFKDIDPYSKAYQKIISIIKNVKIPQEFNIDFISEFVVEGEPIENIKTNNVDYTFVDNAFNPIHEILLKEIENNESPSVLKIATPFLSKSYSENFINFISKIQPSKIQLFTRNTNKISDQFNNVNIPLEIYRPIKNKSKKDFHGKMILLEYENYIKLFIGSANFSEQGFFKSLINYGNQECGIIQKIDDPKEIKSIQDWFMIGWEKPLNIEKWNETVLEADNEFEDEIYAFAIRESKKVILMISNPFFNGDSFNISVNKKTYRCTKRFEYNLYHLELNSIPPQTEILKVVINEKEFPVQIFDPEIYKEWIKKNDDSLFTFQQTKIESLIEKVLSEAIEKEGIKVSSGQSYIVEPPLLEQFYQNVRNQTSAIKSRKYFNQYHLKELEDILKDQRGGMGIYLIMQFLNAFKYIEEKNNISLKGFTQLCNNQLNVCLENLDFDKENFSSFIDKWIINE
ncbi:MAG: hypothetical protein WAR79_14300 [Melioribacteraceae bacterium]